ncbi:MAG: primosomal protein N' [Rhodoferax sp.]
MTHRLRVLVATPAHAALGSVLTYRCESALAPGTLVRVPLGSRETLGVVWKEGDSPTGEVVDAEKIRPVAAVLDGVTPLPVAWLQLVTFTAQYYQRSLGEVALAALPPQLRELSPLQWARRLKRMGARTAGRFAQVKEEPAQRAEDTEQNAVPSWLPTPQTLAQAPVSAQPLTLTPEQAAALDAITAEPGPFLLFGATGSGKTEVYLQAVERALHADPAAQALVMVPEINLTPQLEARFVARFAPRFGAQAVVSLHSAMTPAQRLNAWLAAHSGSARIVLGTRMAVLASLPGLCLVVVDEEHDPSYKSGEGARYSARDLAVYRGRLEGAKVILGSATPSLESWHHARPSDQGGRYRRLDMGQRSTAGAQSTGTADWPTVRRVDMQHQPRGCVIAPPLLEAIRVRVQRGEQSLLLLNRRGYAPVLHCADCGWKSQCPHCSAFRVFHKIDRSLRCHHCGLAERVPRGCPECGNADIGTIGRGTERLEEHLAELLVDVRRPSSAEFPDGAPVRIARIDADTTRAQGALQSQLAAVHAGDVDVLVGTQMVAKGHDFRRVTLVAAINPDGALFSSDYRAPERLFALLMQAGGRAGRDPALRAHSEVWIQTFQIDHPLFAALKAHDYPAFAQTQLREREQAALPPFTAQALVRAEARTQAVAQAFLNAARDCALRDMAAWDGWADVLAQITLYGAVPMALQRVANVERAQMLVESPSRAALQQFLAAWQPLLHAARSQPEARGLIRWAIDVDPLSI